MEIIKLTDGRTVSKADYIKAKTKDLQEFGYTSLTEEETKEQLEKVIAQDEGLSVIGMFIQSDIEINF